MPEVGGRYEFAPVLGPGGKRVRRDGATTDWWLIIRCAPDLGRYFRTLHELDNPGMPRPSEPLWGAHVSVVRNEPPPLTAHWKDRDGAEVMLEYDHEPRVTGGYLFLPARCEAALDYREYLGLPRQPEWPLHLTVGNWKNAQAGGGDGRQAPGNEPSSAKSRPR